MNATLVADQSNAELAARLREIAEGTTAELYADSLLEAAQRIEKIKGGRKRAAIAVRYLHDGKPMSDTQNKLSSVAWFYGKTADGKRMSVGEFRTYLVEHGVPDPNVPGWSCTMPSGVVISTIGLDERVQLTVAQEDAQAQGIADAVIESAKNGPNADVTRAQRGANLRSKKTTAKKAPAKKAAKKSTTTTKRDVQPRPKKAAAAKS